MFETETLIKQEAQVISEELGGSIGLNDYFIQQSCTDKLKKLLLPLSEENRSFVIDGGVKNSYFIGYLSPPGEGFILPYGDIEMQLPEGISPRDYFETPEDWICETSCSSILCYVNPGPALFIEVDLSKVREAINWIKEE